MKLNKKKKNEIRDMEQLTDEIEFIDLDADDTEFDKKVGVENTLEDSILQSEEDATIYESEEGIQYLDQTGELELLNLDATGEIEISQIVVSDTEEVDFEEDDIEESDFLDEDFWDETKDDEKTAAASVKSEKPAGKAVGSFSFMERINGFFSNLFADFTKMDGLVYGTGVVILAAILVVVGIWVRRVNVSDQSEAIAQSGRQLTEIGILGQSGLVAVTDAELARQQVPVTPTQEPEEEEPEESETVEVRVSFTSVEKDLKIKFTNNETGKLVNNAQFVVALTDSSGVTVTYTDSDMDGIIYNATMAPGRYTVAIEAPARYELLSYDTTVTVRDTIVYQQIDVADEVKSESEVNTATEDTQGNVALEEEIVTGDLEDTVEWVESTCTTVGSESGYAEIPKSSVIDPSLVASSASYARAAYMGELPGTVRLAGTDRILTVNHAEAGGTLIRTGGQIMPYDEPTDTPITSGGADFGNGTTGAPEQTGTPNPTEAPDPTEAPGSTETPGPTEPPSPTEAPVPVVPDELEVSLDKTSASMYVGEEEFVLTPSISLVMSDGSTVTVENQADVRIEWTSSKTSVATVTGGKVTALSAGNATITLSVTYTAGGHSLTATAKCEVTVKAAELTIKLNKETLSIEPRVEYNLVATVIKNGVTYTSDRTENLVTWTSSDTAVATVDKTGRITAIKQGTVTITATTVDLLDGKAQTAVCTLTVTRDLSQDTTSRLSDADGNQVYIRNASGQYVEATFADYYSASAFYIKSSIQYRYTGWQTIDNKTYYFDKNGNYVTGEQVIQGVRYNFDNSGVLSMGDGTLGIDVSSHNGTINWTAVRNAGVSYVIIRCGYRGSTQGALIEDSKFRQNIEGANAAGLKVGVYFYTQAVSEREAIEEASMVLSLVQNYRISYPIFIDTEASGGRADGIGRETRTAVCRAFCETIRNGGYTAGVYACKSWFTDKLNAGSLSSYKIWLAQYATTPTYTGRYDLWQRTDKGTISGISTAVDLNYSYLGY